MRTTLTLTAMFGLLFLGGKTILHAQSDTIYVNVNAAGNFDGTSWADAFADLQMALAAAEEGDEVWVAQGTYFPDTMGGDRASTFFIEKNIHLRGGFSGLGGTSANEQDPDQWITRLSGDLAQDDVPDSLHLNREDNVWTVVTVGMEVTDGALIDGFYIQNGHADGDFSAFQNERGGGCFSFGSPVVSRCVFDNNFATEGGGGLYLHTGGAEGTLVTDCLFISNEAEEGGGAMCYIQGGEGATFMACSFDGNRAEDGGGLRIYNSNALLDDCHFQSNEAERGGGVDVRSIWDDNETQVLNSFFSENMARHGGGIHFQTQSGLGAHNNFLTLNLCEFIGNQATINDFEADGGRQGGAIRATIERTTNGCGVRILNSDFTMNSSERDGGAILAHMRGETMTFLLENSFVEDNTARNGAGVFINASDVGSGTATVRDCDFYSNWALTADGEDGEGGALRFLGRESSRLNYVVDSSDFILNRSWKGGALAIESRDTAEMDILAEDNLFEENEARVGGVVSSEANGSTFSARFNRCIMRMNSSQVAGIVAALPSTSEEAKLTFENCQLTDNDGNDGVFTIDLFRTVRIINCTVADNWHAGLHVVNDGQVFLQNNVFFHTSEFSNITSTDLVTSGGGNLMVGEFTNPIAFLGPFDQTGLDPVFNITANGYYLLNSSSPAVDMGILPDVVPEFDLLGNERVVNCIDAGAFENPNAVSSACLTEAGEIEDTLFDLSISPNPAGENVRIAWDFDFGEATLELIDVHGRVLRSEKIRGTGSHEWAVSHLPKGVYFVKMATGKGSAVQRFVVQ